MRIFFLLLILVTLIFVNFYKSCHPSATIIDGDTFKIGKERYRIYGIDVPELSKQKEWFVRYTKITNESCLRYYAYLAKEELEEIFAKYCILLKYKGKDKFNRTLVIVYNCTFWKCTDVGRYFVLKGYAISFGNVYKEEEEIARKHKRGFWSCYKP